MTVNCKIVTRAKGNALKIKNPQVVNLRIFIHDLGLFTPEVWVIIFLSEGFLFCCLLIL